MADFTFLHAADIHLDSPLRGLEHYDGAPVDQVRGSTRRAFEKLVNLCLEQRCQFLLLAGDLYDGDWKDYNTGLFFVHQMSRLNEAGIHVISVRGNHDAASQISRHLRLPENVVDLCCKKPETVLLEEYEVAIHGQGFATKAVTDDLTVNYPSACPGFFNIGLLHTSVSGREGHEHYAPCALEGLLSKGYDYWALGHVHKREVLHKNPWVVFPGNLQGRHIRETGEKGATLVTVRDGTVLSVEHKSLDVLRWALCTVDISKLKSDDDLLDQVQMSLVEALKKASGHLLAVRLLIKGRGPLHAPLSQESDAWVGQFRALAVNVGGSQLWLEKVQIRSRAQVDLAELRQGDDPLGALLRSLAELKAEPEKVRDLIQDGFKSLFKKIPKEMHKGIDGFDLEDSEALRLLIDDVEQLLIPQLLAEENR
jgi:DNA repair protein SbcD/Mre11